MTRWMLTAAALAVSGLAAAKLPPPDDAAKAKAAETAAKAAWQAKVDTFQLCKAQDRIAARYKSNHPAAAQPATAAASAMPPASAMAAASAASAAKVPPQPTGAAASTGGPATPVAATAPTPPVPAGCADPGPFAYTPPEQKPLETSGAHSPPGTAISPPSVRPEAATMTPNTGASAAKK